MTDPFKYREVRGTFLASVGDTVDADLTPDSVPLNGSVKLTPQYSSGAVSFDTGVLVSPQEIVAAIVDGELRAVVSDGEGGLTYQDLHLPVTVDERADQTWYWIASFPELTIGDTGQAVKLDSRRFAIEDGEGPVNLTAVASARVSGAILTKGAPGVGVASVSAVGGEALKFTKTDGTADIVEIPGGIGGGGMPDGVVPIFPTLAEAQAWESANPGRVALTLEGDNSSLPIVPAAPTMDDIADTYTIPVSAGVEYLVGGTVVEAGTHSVGNVAQTITVSARATGQRPLAGDTVWPLVFTLASEWVTIAQTDLDVPDTTDVESIPLTEPAGGTLVKGGDYALAVESGRLIKRVGTGVNHGGSLTISSPANVPGIRTVRFTLGYDLTAGTSAAPGFNFQWSALFNGNPSSAVMQVQVRREPDGTLGAAGAGSRVTDVQTLAGTIPASGVMVVTVGTAQVTVEVDGTEVVSAAIASTYTLNPEQTPRVDLLATTPALDSLLIEAGT